MLKSVTKSSLIIYNPEEGFLRVSSILDYDVELSDAKHDFCEAAKLINYIKMPVLADSRNVTYQTKEVREFYASKEMGKNITAMAVLVDSLASKILGNFFIKANKPHFPTKLFTDEQLAVNWLMDIIKKEKQQSSSENLTVT